VGGVAWVNHNLSLGATARTILLDATAAAGTHVPERIAPNAIEASTNMSGAVTDIDEDPYSLDANKMSSTDQLANIRLSFPTPAATPSTATDAQMFRVAITYTGSLGFQIQLYEAGSFVRTLGHYPQGGPGSPETGTVLYASWSTTELADQSGADAECRIVCNSSSVDFDLEAVDWLCDSGVSAGSILGDSGWTSVTMDQYDADWGATVSGAIGSAPQQTFLHTFSDANVSSVAKIVTYFRDPLNSAGYINLGEFVVGPIFVPDLNLDWGEVVSIKGRDKLISSDGGGRWGIRREPTRSVKINLSNLSTSEAQSVLERFWRAGMLMPYVIQVLDDATESRHTTLYVCTDSMPRMTANFVDYRAVSFEATEKL
jgi:hypothetical protein